MKAQKKGLLSPQRKSLHSRAGVFYICDKFFFNNLTYLNISLLTKVSY